MKRLAIFDCDGTLVDSQASICAAMGACFADEGLAAPDPDRVRRIVGLSLPQAMAALLPDLAPHRHLVMADAYKAAFQRMRRERPVEEPLYEGIADLLDTLEADGWLLGVATGKSDRGLALCLDRHGLGGRFATLQTADRHPSKPHPAMIAAALAETGGDPKLSMMIGDTSYDMAMARAAGVRAVGVAWGYHEADELRAAGADCVAMHPSDIPALTKALA